MGNHDGEDGGIPGGDELGHEALDFDQRGRLWDEQLDAFGVAMPGRLAKSDGVVGSGLGDGEEELRAFDVAIPGSEVDGFELVGGGVGGGNEQPDALRMAEAGSISQGHGIVGFGIGDGDEELDAIGVAIFGSEVDRLGLAGHGVGDRDEQFDAFRVAIIGSPAQSKGTFRFGVGDRDEKLDAFRVAVVCGPSKRRRIIVARINPLGKKAGHACKVAVLGAFEKLAVELDVGVGHGGAGNWIDGCGLAGCVDCSTECGAEAGAWSRQPWLAVKNRTWSDSGPPHSLILAWRWARFLWQAKRDEWRCEIKGAERPGRWMAQAKEAH